MILMKHLAKETLMKKTITVTRCEKCLNGDKCRILNQSKCKNFVVTVNSNFEYRVSKDIVDLQNSNIFSAFIN
jgi:hypothetical protein